VEPRACEVISLPVLGVRVLVSLAGFGAQSPRRCASLKTALAILYNSIGLIGELISVATAGQGANLVPSRVEQNRQSWLDQLLTLTSASNSWASGCSDRND